MMVQDEKKMKKMILNIKEFGIKEAVLHSLHNKITEMKETKNTYKNAIGQTLQSYKTIDGVFLGEVNRKLNLISKRGLKQKELDNGNITLVLSRKKTNELATKDEIARIEEKINQLEGFENLRLSQFYSFQPKYFEKKWLNNVIRWVEIRITNPF